MVVRKIRVVVISSLIFSGPIHAHHSWVPIYDADTIVTLTGVVTEVWLTSPHSRLFVGVTTENGEILVWDGETWPESVLRRRGWAYTDLKEGDQVIISGEPARNGRLGLHLGWVFRPKDNWSAWVGLAPIPTHPQPVVSE